jgi:hypothetical protein
VAWLFVARALVEAAGRVRPATWEADREFRDGVVALAGVATGALLVGAVPGDGPLAPPLPEGQTVPEGAGFIHPGDRVPGQIKALGAGFDRPASTLAKPGTIRDLQRYLRRAPLLWRERAAAYPARADFFEARAKAVPNGELRNLSGREVAAWLVAEKATVDQLDSEGIDVGAEIREGLAGALASGITEMTTVPE